MRTLLVLLVALLTLPPDADAQGLRGLAERARSAVTGEAAPRARAGVPPPAPVYGAFLNAFRLTEQRGIGTYLDLQSVSFVFLPDTEGTADLYRDGRRVAGFTWETYTASGPFYDVEPPQMTWPESGFNALGYVFERGGDYEMVYSVGGEPFWRFPFQVVASGGDDPYAPTPSYSLRGAWDTDAYILHDDRESGSWTFKVFLHPDDIHTDMAPLVTVSRAGSAEPILVGGSPNQRLGVTEGRWNRKDYELQWPGRRGATRGEYYDNPGFRANTERLDDGDYVLTLDLNPGRVARYPFAIADGEIVPQGRQAPNADPSTRIDGGGAAMWLVRE